MSKSPMAPLEGAAAIYAKEDAQRHAALRQWAVEQAIKIMKTPDDVERIAGRFLHYVVNGEFPGEESAS